MTDRRDRVTVRWTPPDARPRRLVFEPRSVGGWERCEQVWTGDRWRHVGREIVADLEVET